MYCYLRDEATIWVTHFTFEIFKLSDEEYERIYLDRWSHAGKNDKESTKGLFSCAQTFYYRFMDVFNRKMLLFL
jgi:hypothetical protein